MTKTQGDERPQCTYDKISMKVSFVIVAVAALQGVDS